MRYKNGQKAATYKRILVAAERCFKREGYNGIGIDGLAKEAGVTSGAFYGHFKSKINVFIEAIVAGLTEVKQAVEELQQQHGEQWWYHFAKFYMTQRRTCDLSESCALQSLTPEIIRANDEIKKIYEQELLEIVLVASKKNKLNREKAWVNLSMLTGGVNLSRAVNDKKIASEIAQAVLNQFKLPAK
jgi:AcrR family transcriptional regulator